MRVGDVSVELVPVDGGEMIEAEDGRVLALARQVYAIRITNHSDRRAVARVSLDGLPVTDDGLVLHAGEATELERPVTEGEHGRFTVFPEGTEAVFGDDGGRDNPDLGLVEVEYRRELARFREPVILPPIMPPPGVREFDFPPLPAPLPRPGVNVPTSGPAPAPASPARYPAPAGAPPWFSLRESDVAGAAGTGLTGRSSQTFRTVTVGPLEEEPTRVRLRIVIGAPEAFDRPRPLPDGRSGPVPPRPAPRP